VGLIAYWWYCFITTGDAFAQATSMATAWGWAVDWPWRNFVRDLSASATDRFWALGSLSAFVASLLLLRYRMYEEFAFCFAAFLLAWASVLPQSLVRYALVLFPIYIALARATASHPVMLASIAGSLAALNAYLLIGFSLNWRIAV
jgi:hypothetical protein